MTLRLFKYLALLMAFTSLEAQTPSFNFQKLGSEEGLNNANIFNIEQHENGLLYFTTQNGIYSYDGYNFSKLLIDSLRSNALITASIKNKNQLYLSLRDEGIATLDLGSRTYSLQAPLKLADNNADNVLVTDDYAYLLISRIRLVIVDLKKGKVLDDQLKKSENLAFCLYKTKTGRILLGRSDGLYELKGAVQKNTGLSNGQSVYAITEDKTGRLFLGSSGKMLVIENDKVAGEIVPQYSTRGNTLLPDGLARSINKIITDDYGKIWFTSYPEENLYLYVNNTVYDVFQTLDIPPSLIRCLFRDEQQNIWVGTNNDGVYFIQNAFFNSVNFSFSGKILSINQVLLKDQVLVAATSNGLYGLSLNNYQAKTLSRPDEVFLEPIFSISEGKDVFYYSKRSEFNLFPGIFFAGSNSYRFKPVISKIFYPLDNDRSILADWNLNILLSNGDGSKVLDTLISFSDYRISVNTMLKEGDVLYVGTSNGLFSHDFKTGRTRNFKSAEFNFNINDLALIDGRVYAAHEGGITDVTGGRLIEQVGEFSLNTVRKIKYFNDQVWLGTLDGVIVCNKEFKPLRILNKSNGLLSNTINDISFSGTNVVIATARGASLTDFRNIIRYSSRLKRVTTSAVMSSLQRISVRNGRYSLLPDQENISIQFYSPYFVRPNKQFFRWRMDEGEWKYFSNTSFEAAVTGGSHKIEIEASADNIQWSEPEELLFVKEEKLSEKTSSYWIASLLSIFVIILVSFIWIRRIKIKSRKRLADEQQVNLLKHQAMNSLLSPHFIFNSLTSIQNYINTNNGLKASEYLAKFSRLIRMIIEKAAQSHITLHDELSRLTYYLELEKERFKNKFDYEIHLDEDLNTQQIQIPNMIIQPYVENCIIHGILPKQEHGVLHLYFRRTEPGRLQILIEDNGIGLIKAAEHARAGHKSLGTSTIRSILEINSKLSGKKQSVTMTDKSTIDPGQSGTLIKIELEL